MSDDLSCVRFIVSGRVQGVFFRASTAAEARRVGIRGWASNLDDGRVEVLAIGSEAAIVELAAWLELGPPSANVTGVVSQQEDLSIVGRVDDFTTR